MFCISTIRVRMLLGSSSKAKYGCTNAHRLTSKTARTNPRYHSTIEVNLAIITGCLVRTPALSSTLTNHTNIILQPSLQPLFRRTFQLSSNFFTSARGSGASKPSFVMQPQSSQEPRRDYNRAELGLPLKVDDKRSTSVGERSEVESEQSVSAMYHAKGTYREGVEGY